MQTTKLLSPSLCRTIDKTGLSAGLWIHTVHWPLSTSLPFPPLSLSPHSHSISFPLCRLITSSYRTNRLLILTVNSYDIRCILFSVTRPIVVWQHNKINGWHIVGCCCNCCWCNPQLLYLLCRQSMHELSFFAICVAPFCINAWNWQWCDYQSWFFASPVKWLYKEL